MKVGDPALASPKKIVQDPPLKENFGMEPVVTTESIDELPWGPGTIRLLEPLVIEVTDDSITETVTVYAEAFGLWGDGATYTDALLDFGATVEAYVDDLRSTPLDKMHVSAVNALAKIEKYLPPQDDEDY
jgi:hypothetical protein